MSRKMGKLKSPFRLTFDEALQAAINLVKQEHGSKMPCAKCRKTLALLSQLRVRLNQMAVASNLVWYAMRGERRIDVRD